MYLYNVSKSLGGIHLFWARRGHLCTQLKAFQYMCYPVVHAGSSPVHLSRCIVSFSYRSYNKVFWEKIDTQLQVHKSMYFTLYYGRVRFCIYLWHPDRRKEPYSWVPWGYIYTHVEPQYLHRSEKPSCKLPAAAVPVDRSLVVNTLLVQLLTCKSRHPAYPCRSHVHPLFTSYQHPNNHHTSIYIYPRFEHWEVKNDTLLTNRDHC